MSPDAPPDAPPSIEFPLGQVVFSVPVAQAGGRVMVTLFLENGEFLAYASALL